MKGREEILSLRLPNIFFYSTKKLPLLKENKDSKIINISKKNKGEIISLLFICAGEAASRTKRLRVVILSRLAENEIYYSNIGGSPQHKHCKKFASLRSSFAHLLMFFIFKGHFNFIGTLTLSNIIFLSSPLAKLKQKNSFRELFIYFAKIA